MVIAALESKVREDCHVLGMRFKLLLTTRHGAPEFDEHLNSVERPDQSENVDATTTRKCVQGQLMFRRLKSAVEHRRSLEGDHHGLAREADVTPSRARALSQVQVVTPRNSGLYDIVLSIINKLTRLAACSQGDLLVLFCNVSDSRCEAHRQHQTF